MRNPFKTIRILVVNKSGRTPFAEIEYPFMTEEGHYFQPRLRRIGTKEDLN